MTRTTRPLNQLTAAASILRARWRGAPCLWHAGTLEADVASELTAETLASAFAARSRLAKPGVVGPEPTGIAAGPFVCMSQAQTLQGLGFGYPIPPGDEPGLGLEVFGQ